MHTHETANTSFVPPVTKSDSVGEHSRAFQVTPPETAETAEPDIQARLDHANRFGHDLTRSQPPIQRQVEPDAEREEEEEPVIQTKLTIGQPGDQYEQEADAMAAKVMAMPEPGGEVGEQGSRGAGVGAGLVPAQAGKGNGEDVSVQRVVEEEGEEKEDTLQAKPQIQARGNAPAVPANFEGQLAQHQGGGRPLSDETRAFMEPRFGTDFSHVRIHETPDLANAIQAQAFTHGQDIYFNAGKYEPGSSGGKELLAHELTHTLQQTEQSIQLQPSEDKKSHLFWSWYNSKKGKTYQSLRQKLEKVGYEFQTRIASGPPKNGSLLWQNGLPKKDTLSKEVAWSIKHPNGKWSWATTISVVPKCRTLLSSQTYWEWWRSEEGKQYDQLRKQLKEAGYKFVRYVNDQGAWKEGDPENSTKANKVAWSIGSPDNSKWFWTTAQSIVSKCQVLQKELRGKQKVESLNSQFSKDSIYEIIARDVAYAHSKEKISSDILKQLDLKKDDVEIIHGYYGFQMASIRWSNPQRQGLRLPILAFEGSNPKELLDWIDDTNPNGIGFNQFQKSKKLIKKTIDKLGGRIDVTGHSLGGALAQMTAATFPENVRKVVTFQSPGLNSDFINSLEDYNSKVPDSEKVESFHYRASTGDSLLGGLLDYDGDVVDDAGQKFTPGAIYKLPTESPSDAGITFAISGGLIGGLAGASAGYHAGQMFDSHTKNILRDLLALKESDPEAFRRLTTQVKQTGQVDNLEELLRPAEIIRSGLGAIAHGSLENLTSDDRVRERVLKEPNYLNNKGLNHKIKMIEMLMDGIVSSGDITAIEKICRSVKSSSERARIREKIEPQTVNISSFEKRTRIRVALSRIG